MFSLAAGGMPGNPLEGSITARIDELGRIGDLETNTINLIQFCNTPTLYHLAVSAVEQTLDFQFDMKIRRRVDQRKKL